jgi:hypothetical protein
VNSSFLYLFKNRAVMVLLLYEMFRISCLSCRSVNNDGSSILCFDNGYSVY